MGRDNNEGIYLWLLEQDRQRNRIRAFNATRDSALKPRSIFDYPDSIPKRAHKDESTPLGSAESTRLEQLTAEKAALEAESRRLDEEQKKLNIQVVILCEELLQKMNVNNSEKRQAIIQLKARMSALETQLNKLCASDNSK